MAFKSIVVATYTCLAFISFNASAALIDNGTYTTDTDSGLDWLDLTETTGITRDNLLPQMVSGGQFEEWRYATSAEVVALWTNWNVDLRQGALTFRTGIFADVSTATISTSASPLLCRVR